MDNIRDLLLFSSGVAKPVANFSVSPGNIGTPVNEVFTDLSTNHPTSWHWQLRMQPSPTWVDFTTPTVQNPAQFFDVGSGGVYDIRLTASNAGGSNTNTKLGYLIVSDA